ncbi:MAG: RidA family protein [Chlorobiaceae bacterium]|nr:RidA family protein [Chlorobiales bacterium]NTU91023.1 RidA family protein [Chlorobiaceae bacterium]NTV26286.1 RidA family protein [Chlorobiaceae bacterium]
MTKKFDVKEKARDILEETLDMEAVVLLSRISEEMQLIFSDNPAPTFEDAARIVTEYFVNDGRPEVFIEDWLRTARDHSRSRGLDDADQPKAILSDLGVFRFMWFLKEKGLSEEQIDIVLTGAVQQATDQREE